MKKMLVRYNKDKKRFLRSDLPDDAYSGIVGNMEYIDGDTDGIWGNVGGIYGDVSGLYGDVTGIRGDTTRIYGNLEDCEITEEDRKNRVNINDLIRED